MVENLRLQTHVREDGPHPTLVVSGEIDVFTAPLFKQAVVNLVADGQRHLFLDMRGVTFMDSSGFGALLGATKRLRPEGGSLNRRHTRIASTTRMYAGKRPPNQATKPTGTQ